MEIGQLLVIEAHEVEDRRVKVMHVGLALRHPEPEFVGGSLDRSPPDPAPGHPGRKSGSMMVAAPGSHRGPAKLSRPHNQGLIQQASRLEIGKEAGDGLVGLATEFLVPLVVFNLVFGLVAGSGLFLDNWHQFALTSKSGSLHPGLLLMDPLALQA